MNTKFEKLIFRLGTNPPTTPRAEALRLREAFEALSPEERKANRKAHGNYPYLKEAETHLPKLDRPRATALEAVLSAELDGWNVSAGWDYLNGDLPEYLVKRVLQRARKHFQDTPGPEFEGYFKQGLEREWRKRQPGARKRKKTSARKRQRTRRTQPQPPVSPTAAQPQQQDRVVTKRTSNFDPTKEPWCYLLAAGASKHKISEAELQCRLIERMAREDLDWVPKTSRETEPPPPAKAAKTSKPAPRPVAAAQPATPKKEGKDSGKKKEKMPYFHERLKIVMGDKTVTLTELARLLTAHDKSWVPESMDLNRYLSWALSTHVEDGTFERISRGKYRVRRGPKVKTPNGSGGTNGKGPSNGKTSNGSPGSDVDMANVIENPFAPVAA